MKDNRKKSLKTIDTFFRKIAEEAKEFPLRVIDIPDTDHDKAGICLLADDRTPAAIDEVTAAIFSGAEDSPIKNPSQNKSFSLQNSLSIEVERARFTSTFLSLVLVKINRKLAEEDNQDPATFLKDDLQRVDIVTTFAQDTLAVLMPETGGQDAKKRAECFLSTLGETAAGCGVYSSFGNNCPGSDEFIKLATRELDRSCKENGRVSHNKFEEPPSCQVSVEEKSALFNLFGKDGK